MFNIESRTGTRQQTTQQFSEHQSLHTKKNNRKKRSTTVIIALVVITLTIIYYLSIPNRYFRSPLNIPTEIAGSFGEVRKDHFHLGIDIRTGGMENIPVYAMADGYIYRVSMKRDGYGKALYIAYNNGLMSVYAHLNSFSEEVATAVNKQQLLSEQWEQELFYSPRRFPVNKGALVAYSGNSGSSEGPHIHLELRNSKTKTILNPVLAGINHSDNVAPAIRSVWLYNGSQSLYGQKGLEIKYNDIGSTGKDHPIKVADSVVRIGIEANDKGEDSKFRLGIYHVQLLLDDKLRFEFKMDSIPTAKERYVNATIDYSQWFHQKRIIQLLFRLPGNSFPAYQQSKENGAIDLSDDQIHRVTILVKDASDNSNGATFLIRYKPAVTKAGNQPELLIPGMPHKISKGSAVVYFSPLAFYDAVPFSMTELKTKTAGSISKTIKVCDPAVPVHTRYRIQLKTTLHKNDPARKFVLMELSNGKEKKYVKGDWKGDYMDGSFDHFGMIRLIYDRIPPHIAFVKSKRWFDHGEMMSLDCSDNTGHVENFTARIDGQWTPFEQKKNTFYYYLPKELKKGNHCLEIECNDQVGNTSKKKIEFVVR